MIRILPSLLVVAFAGSTLQNGPILIPRRDNPQPTLRTSARLVVLDVQVTDVAHHPVHGLKANDFTVLENGSSQKVRNFDEHSGLPAVEMAKIPAMPKLPSGVFTNFNPVPSAVANGPVSVLLIDRLNTAMMSQVRLHNALIAYLRSMKPGQRIAIFTLTHRLSQLQGFSDDPDKLLKIADKAVAKGSPLIDDSIDDEMMGNSAFIKDSMLRDRGLRTMEALNELARFLVNIPGRKNLVWISGSFPLTFLPESDGTKTFESAGTLNQEFGETVSLLSQAQVAVYPVGAEGAWASQCFSVKRSNPCTPAEFMAESNTHWEADNTMREIAYQTGGRAFIDDNDMAGAIAESLDDGSNYYTLTYTPADGDWKGDFRKIQVKLRQQGLELNFRRGYFADDPLAPPTSWQRLGSGRAVTAPLSPPPGYDSMQIAMMHGGPQPAEIVFSAQVAPATAVTEATLAPGNRGSKGLAGPYRRYALTFSANPRGLHLNAAPDGSRRGDVQFVTFVYTRDGKPLNGLVHTVHVDLTQAQYADALKNNLAFHQEISVPEKDGYSLRMAMHDLQSDRVGAVEVPVASVRGLPPAMASAAPASR